MGSPSVRPIYRWRVVDIVVASVLAVAAGLVFVLWNIASNPLGAPLSAALPGLQALVGGGWLFAGVLTALVIRKPGAALYGELVAAIVSALVGNQWGVLTIESGLVQGLAAELVFAAFVYRRWGLPVAVLAGAAAGLAMGINDLILWYPGSTSTFAAIYVVSGVVSGALIAGALSWYVVRGLAKTGALSRFASGRVRSPADAR
ncbi:ECF transporter S component [Mycolicibacterium rufum]|uniref:ECF transporter S component n=1 Tax=Mycolicibacterium rufum TaxID=318424 RepID=A0A9X2XZX4_9MYCO|nr:ECF transporter S component [Mycolicibacterium rufum]KGI70502.1 membrane protein [Mycolicibacterium rufum]MCV7071716.1 ECF transporter S component [Mycolicibacterium rufum]ULP36843.1 ECF transporter S component [Mycolicibacterium rufum]